jgi:hypothetical protein
MTRKMAYVLTGVFFALALWAGYFLLLRYTGWDQIATGRDVPAWHPNRLTPIP